ncbi:hypothetical protein G9C85_14105 [Halorubellus sp. JP-L1]|uniref:HalOD1 output domain-containing protein n=1 Tax=Halorubellus sp. JP-L1 TaxID=2715753 RepID=UPI001407913F|nr:HalOD1 output domain-containing protein [Halorubellus sp. JP-L1]NHN42755.1 hypothetical protein [Halorubellus sp. JP-L1]
MIPTSNSVPGPTVGDEDPVSMRVVDRVADVTGTDPLDLEPLYDVVDPDHLDALFERNDGVGDQRGAEVRFVMEGCDVVVSADGSIDVTRRSGTATAIAPGPGVETQADSPGSVD